METIFSGRSRSRKMSNGARLNFKSYFRMCQHPEKRIASRRLIATPGSGIYSTKYRIIHARIISCRMWGYIIIKLSQSFPSHIYFYVKNKNQYLSGTHWRAKFPLFLTIPPTKTFNFCKTIHEKKKCDDSYKKKTPSWVNARI